MWRVLVTLMAGLIAAGAVALSTAGARPGTPDLGESVVIVPTGSDPDARRDGSATALVTEEDDSGDGDGDGSADGTPVTDGRASWITRVGDTTTGDSVDGSATVASRPSAATAPSATRS